MTDPTTPAAFVALVEPHLPIGPYTHIGLLDVVADEVTIKRNGKWIADMEIPEAGNLLLGAIVAECHHFDIEHDAPTPTLRVQLAIGLDGPWGYSDWIDACQPFALLKAALLARAEARKAGQ